jgi:2-polyprenyl-6-hydroxyphenyl methylase/3-demethylubiquinone-9 3-methyltransferase
MNNVSALPKEISRYNALAADWWNPRGLMWPLHRLNALRAPYVVETIMSHFSRRPGLTPLAGLSILDIGCGAGLLSEAMALAGATVTGVDPAANNISIAKAHAKSASLAINYIHGGIEVVEGEQFDVVLNMEVVEHVANLPAFMSACGQCIAPSGMTVVATLNRTLRSFIVAIIGAEYLLRWLPKGTHNWRQFVTVNELTELLDPKQMTVFRQAGVAVNPLTRRYHITNTLSVNYMLSARHIINN